MNAAVTYQQKPGEIEAVQWFQIGDHPSVYYSVTSSKRKCKKCGKSMSKHGWIHKLEGALTVCPGDWIITGDTAGKDRQPKNRSIRDA